MKTLKQKIQILDNAFGIWGKGPSGKKQQAKMRKEWKKREKATH
jgi:hypothetical protein